MFILRAIFRFIKFVIREIFSFIIKFSLIILIGFSIFSYYMKSTPPALPKDTYLEIDLGAKYNESIIESPLSFEENSMTFYQLLKKIELAKDDSQIKGIILKLDGLSLSRNQISELGKILNEFKSTEKPIYSYGVAMDNNTLLMSSYSTKSIMPPTASSIANVTGYSRELPYYKNLADKFGIEFNVINVGDFKSFGENFKKENISPEHKENLQRIFNKSYSYFIEDFSKNKNLDKNIFSENVLAGKFMGESSKILFENKLISELNYFENLKELEPRVTIQNYFPKIKISKNKIALIYADGEITYSPTRSLKQNITPENLISQLEKAEEDENIKGVVLRVNSPGGSALASDIIHNYVKNMKKPVYISIGEVAASGGYYISVGGDKIFSSKESLTGSIGVVSLIPNFEKLSKKIGINMNEISMGKYSDLYSLTSPFTEEKKEKLYKANLDVYNEFLEKVSEGRKMSKEEVHKIAQGQVWLGGEALENGLVDFEGGVMDTVYKLAEDLNLKDDFTVEEFSTKESIGELVSSYTSIIENFNLKTISNPENYLNNFEVNEEFFLKPITYFSF